MTGDDITTSTTTVLQVHAQPFPHDRHAARRSASSSKRPSRDRQDDCYMTPLFVVLVMVDVVDVIFAVDSVPGDLRHHHRPVHRLHVEHLRDPGPARALFRARRRWWSGSSTSNTPWACVLVFIGGKIFVADMLGPRQGSAVGVARRHLRDPGGGRRLLALENWWEARGKLAGS